MNLINLAVVAIFAATLVGLQDVDASRTVNYLNPVRSAQEDEVKYLPCLANQSSIKFKHYSGYLKAFEDGEQEQWLHYWFVESESNPATDPVLLWLNGGPGDSSIDTMFNKIGPFQLDEAGNILADNKFSWNKLANVLYLESPAGVGFSYSNGPLKIIDDDTTAKSNYLALRNFMGKFPQFANNRLYLSGVSYAGTYLPTLGTLVDRDPEFNFKGVAIENGLFEFAKQNSSRIFFAYYHGMIGERTWNNFSNVCCHGKPPARMGCEDNLPECITFVRDFFENFTINYPHIDWFNILRDNAFPWSEEYSSTTNGSPTPIVGDRCSHIGNPYSYLNDRTVKHNIHIPQEVDRWYGFSNDIFNKYHKRYPEVSGSLTTKFKSLIESPRNLTMLVYNGDLDLVCDFLGSRRFVEDLGRETLGEYKPWMSGGRVAGFVQHFDGITFATVRGAGHGASSDRPREGFAIIERFLNAKGQNVKL